MGIFGQDRTSLGGNYNTYDEAFDPDFSAINLITEAYEVDAVVFENLIKSDFLESAGYLNEGVKDTIKGAVDGVWGAILNAIEWIRKKISDAVDTAVGKLRTWRKERYEKEVSKLMPSYDNNMSLLEKVRKPSISFTGNSNICKKISENIEDFKSVIENYASIDNAMAMTAEKLDQQQKINKSEQLYAAILGQNGKTISAGEFKSLFIQKNVEQFKVDFPFANGGNRAIRAIVSGKSNAIETLLDFKKKINEYCNTQATKAKKKKKETKDMESGDAKTLTTKRVKYAQNCISAAQKVSATLFSTYYNEIKKYYNTAFAMFKFGAHYKPKKEKVPKANTTKADDTATATGESVMDAELEYRISMLEGVVELDSLDTNYSTDSYDDDSYYDESYDNYFDDYDDFTW